MLIFLICPILNLAARLFKPSLGLARIVPTACTRAHEMEGLIRGHRRVHDLLHHILHGLFWSGVGPEPRGRLL